MKERLGVIAFAFSIAFTLMWTACSKEKEPTAPSPGTAAAGGEEPAMPGEMIEPDGGLDGGLGDGGFRPDAALDGGSMDTGPQTTGPAQLTVALTVEGEQVDGEVQVLDQAGKVVKKGRSGATFTVESGSYTLKGNITDESVLRDTPTRTSSLFRIGAGSERTEKIEFGRSQVKLDVIRRGRSIKNARIELMPQASDEVVLETKPKDEFIPISPGRYSGIVHWQGNKIEVDNLVFPGGAQRTIPIRIQ